MVSSDSGTDSGGESWSPACSGGTVVVDADGAVVVVDSDGGRGRGSGGGVVVVVVEIGSASCRARVCQYVWIFVVAVSIKKNIIRVTAVDCVTIYVSITLD